MQIVVTNESNSIEKRVALTPDVAKKLISNGFKISLEKDAGEAAGFPDHLYKEAGVEIVSDKKSLLKKAKILLKVSQMETKEITILPKKSIVIGMLKPHLHHDQVAVFNKHKVTSFSLERLPRITRAQSMDVLSSQNNLAGYRAVIEAAYILPRSFPLMMTAAGTIPATKVFVIGVGVAGLQAIATAKRLGAVVIAYDVRAIAQEQVESLGARFVKVDGFQESGDSTGGYTKEMSKEYQKAQSEKIHQTLKDQDIVITTAQLPGKKAPILITDKMIKDMKHGSVIVDMSTETGGNCQPSKIDQVITKNGINIIGYSNLASRTPYNASQLYAKNLFNFLQLMLNKEGAINWQDEIIDKSCLTHETKI